MRQLVFLLEERSAAEAIKGLLPRIDIPPVEAHYLVFEGKRDLEAQIVRRLRGWLRPDTRFVVMRDQDAGDCVVTKERLRELCREAGRPDALVRIACRELESWFLGDLLAVERGLGVEGLSSHQRKAKYRDPDRLGNPVQELSRLTHDRYQKLAGSRAIGVHLDANPERNQSRSFKSFIAGVRRLTA